MSGGTSRCAAIQSMVTKVRRMFQQPKHAHKDALQQLRIVCMWTHMLKLRAAATSRKCAGRGLHPGWVGFSSLQRAGAGLSSLSVRMRTLCSSCAARLPSVAGCTMMAQLRWKGLGMPSKDAQLADTGVQPLQLLVQVLPCAPQDADTGMQLPSARLGHQHVRAIKDIRLAC